MTLLLGDYMSFPDNFKKLFNDGDSEFKSIFKIDLINHKLNHTIEMLSYTASSVIEAKREKKIGEMSIKELVGSSVKEFKEYYQHRTKI